MRLSRDELRKFDRAVAPAPAPVEPALPAAEEAALIAGDKGDDPVIALRRLRVLAMLRRAATTEGAGAELIALRRRIAVAGAGRSLRLRWFGEAVAVGSIR
jgi:hypothetical protein